MELGLEVELLFSPFIEELNLLNILLIFSGRVHLFKSTHRRLTQGARFPSERRTVTGQRKACG
jgi:hypothetical protein